MYVCISSSRSKMRKIICLKESRWDGLLQIQPWSIIQCKAILQKIIFFQFKALDEDDRNSWVQELENQVRQSAKTALTEKQQEEIYEEVKTPHMFRWEYTYTFSPAFQSSWMCNYVIGRFKMQRGSTCTTSSSSSSLISGGDMSINKKSPDIPDKLRKKSCVEGKY